ETGLRGDCHGGCRFARREISLDHDVCPYSVDLGRTTDAETILRRHERQLAIAQLVSLNRRGGAEILDVTVDHEVLLGGRAGLVEDRCRQQAHAQFARERIEVDVEALRPGSPGLPPYL